MQSSQSSTVSTAPWMLVPAVQVLLWMHESVRAIVGIPSNARRTSLALGGTVLLVGLVATSAMLGLHPLLIVGGGLGLSVVFVVAHSWIVAREQQGA